VQNASRDRPDPPATFEREVKLAFASIDAARQAVRALGLTPVAGRRLQDDRLLDTPDQRLRAERSTLRVRSEGGVSSLTFKGPVRPAAVKVREEIETAVGDAETMLRLLAALGFHPWFRYQKYREEFRGDAVVIAVDETPIGVFVEVEGTEAGIDRAVLALGRTRADYILESYYGLYHAWRTSTGSAARDMIFERT
jgi:adenylate cyclase class 2